MWIKLVELSLHPARIKSVDLGQSGTVRPGGPSFGRPVGRSTPAFRGPTTAQKAMAEFNALKRPHEVIDPKVKIIQDMADGFFMKPKVQPEDINLNDPTYQVDLPEVKVDAQKLDAGVKPLDEPTTADFALEALGVSNKMEADQSEDLDQPVAGSHLDVRV